MLNNIHETKKQISTLREDFSQLEKWEKSLAKEMSKLSQKINDLETSIKGDVLKLEDNLLLNNFEYKEMDDSIELIDYIGNNDSVTILGSYNGKKTLITQKFLAKFNVNDVKSLIFKEKDGVKALAISESLNFVFWYSQLEYVDLSGLDTSNVTDMSGMFESCNFLTQVNLKGLNTENVVNMSAMFARCKNLTDLDLSSFNTSNTKYMLSMFEDCDALETLDLSKFNTKNVELMKYMFRGCSNLLSLDLSNFACDNIFDNIYMFSACNSLRKVIVTDATIIEELESNVEILEAI